MIPPVAPGDSRYAALLSLRWSRAHHVPLWQHGPKFHFPIKGSQFEPTNVIVWSGRGELNAALPDVWIGPQTHFFGTMDNEALNSATIRGAFLHSHGDLVLLLDPLSSSHWLNVSGRWLDIADVTSLCEPIRMGAVLESDNGALDTVVACHWRFNLMQELFERCIFFLETAVCAASYRPAFILNPKYP